MPLVKQNARAVVTPSLSRPKSRTFPLAAKDGERLLRVLAESLLIRRRVQLSLWLQGEIRKEQQNPALKLDYKHAFELD